MFGVEFIVFNHFKTSGVDFHRFNPVWGRISSMIRLIRIFEILPTSVLAPLITLQGFLDLKSSFVSFKVT